MNIASQHAAAAREVASARSERLLALDLIRAVLAIKVVAVHAAIYTGYDTFLSGSILCVFYFFLLSGFVLSSAYESRVLAGRFTFRDFLSARFARLCPLHFVTFGAVIVIWCIFAGVERQTGMVLGESFRCKSNELFETLTLTQFVLGGAPCFNSPSWSIGVEWWCGIGLFALMLPLRSDLKVAIALIGVMFFGAIDVHYKTGIVCLALGWATHSISSRLARPHPVLSGAGLATALGISVMTGQQVLAKIPVMDGIHATVLPFAVAVGLCANFAFPKPIGIALRKMGDWSYGIYLWHYPCIFVTLAAFRLLALKGGIMAIQTPWFYAVLYAVVLPVSALSFSYIEKPLQAATVYMLRPSPPRMPADKEEVSQGNRALVKEVFSPELAT
jgi:peptidoglycan/LPS O-acetylase OafA/YrhL